MAKGKKGPTPRRVHKADGELERRYTLLYEQLGQRNRELADARAESASLRLQLAAAKHALDVACSAIPREALHAA